MWFKKKVQYYNEDQVERRITLELRAAREASGKLYEQLVEH